MTTETLDKKTAGFQLGLSYVKKGDYSEVIEKLAIGFGLKTETSMTAFYKRVNGGKPLSPIEIEFTERTLLKYGVPKNLIWGMVQ